MTKRTKKDVLDLVVYKLNTLKLADLQDLGSFILDEVDALRYERDQSNYNAG